MRYGSDRPLFMFHGVSHSGSFPFPLVEAVRYHVRLVWMFGRVSFGQQC